jgi:hypothetical protein
LIKTAYISKAHIVSQVGGSIVSDMGGEKVMLSVRKGKYYNLGEMGGEIWEQIKEPVSVDKLITRLTDKYDVQETSCEREVISFLNHLIEEGLVQTEF